MSGKQNDTARGLLHLAARPERVCELEERLFTRKPRVCIEVNHRTQCPPYAGRWAQCASPTLTMVPGRALLTHHLGTETGLLLHVAAQRAVGGHQDVQAQVELPAADQQRVVDVEGDHVGFLRGLRHKPTRGRGGQS